ncbi:MAG: DUF4173 domain-containing protein, partial [Paracoccaceae bacterium]
VLCAALSWLTGHRNRISIALLTAACLPVIEDLNTLSAAILTLGLISFALRAHGGPAMGWPQLPLAVATFIATALPRAAIDTPQVLRHARQHLPDRPTHLRRNWAMPLGLGICFAILLTLSNPILQTQAERLLTINLAPGNAMRHTAFCLAMAAAIWPVLASPRSTVTPIPPRFDPARLGINATSVSNALILFNALFAVQTALDLTYLWAGTTLPDGMTPASYAHRGAYPLLATALLAGAFVLISRPFAHGRLRALLLIWVAQNVLLVISALYRLDLYVQTFGLTYLRIAAAIWMALVAIGLALTAWQILRRHSNGWLLVRCTVLGATTLYACAFINFAHIIASVNLQRPAHDRDYVCNLGPNAAAAIRAYELQHPQICWPPDYSLQGWRDWGFRTARVERYLAGNPIP